MIVHRLPRRTGLTLIELVVVIAILAVLAGLVISKVDFARRQADMAASADTSAELARNIQLYIITKGSLPNGYDSLLEGGTAIYSKLFDSPPSIVSQSSVTTIANSATDKRINSLGYAQKGGTIVHDHDPAAPYATESGTIPRTLDNASGASNSLLVINPGTQIWNSVYPPGIYPTPPTNVSLVALGIGKGNSMNGVTMVNPPQYPHPDPENQYCRYVVIYAVYFDGRQAKLKTVVDSFGRTVPQALRQFHQAEPE